MQTGFFNIMNECEASQYVPCLTAAAVSRARNTLVCAIMVRNKTKDDNVAVTEEKPEKGKQWKANAAWQVALLIID